jgi:histidine triad (HIT) family protein
MDNECIFCKIVAGEIPCEKVLENDDFIVIKDANPKVDGHLLVIPKEHSDNFLGLSPGLYGGLLESVRAVCSELNVENFNLIVNNGKIAGQLVSHFHLHILPRVEGDGFKLNA